MDWVKATIRDSLILLVFLVIGYGVLQLVDSSISPGEMTFFAAIAVLFLVLRNRLWPDRSP